MAFRRWTRLSQCAQISTMSQSTYQCNQVFQLARASILNHRFSTMKDKFGISTNKIMHEWKTDGADDHINKFQDNKKLAILAIGNTGTGKSALIQLLSDQSVHISSGPERGTNEVTTYQSKYDEKLSYIDTIGLQDNNEDWTDDKLLKETLKYIHYKGFRKIKIIFCVSGDTDSREGLFCKPAKFIGNLKVNEDNNDEKTIDVNNVFPSVWDSVLVIKKKGFVDDVKDISGVLDAAISNGATDSIKTHKHVFGFTCTDWEFDPDDGRYKFVPPDKYAEAGIISESIARDEINKKLNGLPAFELQFKRQICAICGAKGDSRYVMAPCHTKAGYFHTKPIMYYHAGKQKAHHIGGLMETTMNTGEHYHDGKKGKPHIGREECCHPGSLRTTSVQRFVAGLLTLTASEWALWNSEDWYWYDCCNSYLGDATPCGCRWSCCKQVLSATKCTSKHARWKWSCCGDTIYSKGCKQVTQEVEVYKCCKQPNGSDGCELHWTCCYNDHEVEDRGCKIKYPCCEGAVDSEGCSKKCVNCKTDWGKPNGCINAE